MTSQRHSFKKVVISSDKSPPSHVTFHGPDRRAEGDRKGGEEGGKREGAGDEREVGKGGRGKARWERERAEEEEGMEVIEERKERGEGGIQLLQGGREDKETERE